MKPYYPDAKPMEFVSAQDLLDKGGLGISNKYRLVSVVLHDQNACQLLFEAKQRSYDEAVYLTQEQKDRWCETNRKWAFRMGMRAARDHFAGVFNRDVYELTPSQFDAFKALQKQQAHQEIQELLKARHP